MWITRSWFFGADDYGRKGNGEDGILDFIEYCQSGSLTPKVQWLPFQCIQHCGHRTAVLPVVPVVVSANSKSCSSSLHHLKFLNIFLMVRIPYWGTVLQYGSHQSFVCHLFHRNILDGQVSF